MRNEKVVSSNSTSKSLSSTILRNGLEFEHDFKEVVGAALDIFAYIAQSYEAILETIRNS